MKKLIHYFIKGLLIFVPIALTIFLLIWAFTSLDKASRFLFRINIPAIGLLLTVALITVIGFLASNFLGRKFFALI
jgi:uncharacterized membrane protein